MDTLLTRPGKLAAHVAPDIREKIRKGEFVDIFSLISAKRRDVETKDKDAKASSSSDKKPKIEESITNWLFGFNVFMSVMLEKKPETGNAMICYANKILKAHHMYGGNAWLEYDRDFRWAKVEDPAIGWDQTEFGLSAAGVIYSFFGLRAAGNGLCDRLRFFNTRWHISANAR
ncbi:hypothetical protein NDU88_001262 [Pleurodeles waltl]|uniref:Uncharacterized protein n=1 Tax=Pleurodeles waltl TaxID=8319 RepID=A0AAV7MKF4_PLEWA|nr:hypothetical protein NDU88_001262 [Pleurodeles waltl]